MKINFDETPEQLELIKAMGSKNQVESKAAQEAFAALIGPTLGKIYQQADTTKFLYRDWKFKEDEDNSFPLELFSNVPEGYFSVWSNNLPGGVPTNTVHQVIEEVKFTTYRLDTAWSILAKYARQMRLPIISKALERLTQEILLKTNQAAWSVILAALAQAQHTLGAATDTTKATGHVFKSTTDGRLTLPDYNKLTTWFRRVNSSWAGGTPVGGPGKPTDFIVSPEIMEDFRAMAYQPINYGGVGGITATAATPFVMLPEAERERLYKGGGIPEFYGVNMIELLELGKNQDYQILFEEYIGDKDLPYVGAGGALSGHTFDASTDELVIIVDANRDLGIRAIATDAETGSVLSLEPDDQFVKRSGKIGWFGGLEEGRMVLDTKGMAALVV